MDGLTLDSEPPLYSSSGKRLLPAEVADAGHNTKRLCEEQPWYTPGPDLPSSTWTKSESTKQSLPPFSEFCSLLSSAPPIIPAESLSLQPPEATNDSAYSELGNVFPTNTAEFGPGDVAGQASYNLLEFDNPEYNIYQPDPSILTTFKKSYCEPDSQNTYDIISENLTNPRQNGHFVPNAAYPPQWESSLALDPNSLPRIDLGFLQNATDRECSVERPSSGSGTIESSLLVLDGLEPLSRPYSADQERNKSEPVDLPSGELLRDIEIGRDSSSLIDTPKSLPYVSSDAEADPDACFGVIIATSISSFRFDKGSKALPVTIKAFGNVVKLHLKDTDKYVGILDLPVLCKLTETFTVRMEATPTSEQCSLRIILYGMEREKSAVGEMLSDAGLFLQHPLDSECAESIKYCNPHYLLRPGSQMPKLEDLSLSTDTHTSDGSDELDEASVARLMRVFDCTEANGIRVSVDPSPRLRTTLMQHQKTALAMMEERECGVVEDPKFGTLWTPTSNDKSHTRYRHIITGALKSKPSPIYGGVLADEMGLGKTLSILALICSTLDTFEYDDTKFQKSGLRSTLIVCPKSTLPGWEQQMVKHIHSSQIQFTIYHGSRRERMKSILSSHDIILTTHETLRSDWEKKGPLFEMNWLRVVLDEAHHIRNRSSKVFQAAVAVKARYRWCLTGTPIHNSLDDYGALLAFIGVDELKNKSVFDHRITVPFEQNRTGSLQTLKDVVRATCLRRKKTSVASSLGLSKPVEKVEYVELSGDERQIYEFFKRNASIAAESCQNGGSKANRELTADRNILASMNTLRLICDHGRDLLPPYALEVWTRAPKEMLDKVKARPPDGRCFACGEIWQEMTTSHLEMDSPDTSRTACASCSLNASDTSIERKEFHSRATMEAVKSEEGESATDLVQPSSKIRHLLRNLRAEQATNEGTPVKSVVFTQWTKMLDLIQAVIQRQGFIFQRIDGQTSLEARGQALHQFHTAPECTVMLASIGSCGEGVDLTTANYVHLIEPHWNPMVEAQAIDRVHRKGQGRPVTVTRYIVPRSIEKYVQWVQKEKLMLINQSINDMDVEKLQGSDENKKWMMLQKCLSK